MTTDLHEGSCKTCCNGEYKPNRHGSGELYCGLLEVAMASMSRCDHFMRRVETAAPVAKPIRQFLQVDGWQECAPGLSEHERHVYSVHPDADGEVTMASMVAEPRNTDFPVRVQIHEGSDKAQVLRLLGKVTSWLERDFDELMRPPKVDPTDPLPF